MTDYHSTPLEQLRVLHQQLVQRKTRMGRSVARLQRLLGRETEPDFNERPQETSGDVPEMATAALTQMAFGSLCPEDILTLSRQKRRLAGLLAQRADKIGQHSAALAQAQRLEHELGYLDEETARLTAHIEAQEHALSHGPEGARILMAQVAQSPKTLAARLKSAARAELEADCCRAIAQMVELDQELNTLLMALRDKECRGE